MRTILLPVLLIGLPLGLHAQATDQAGPRQEVIAVVDRFFALLTARDSAGMAHVLEPEGEMMAVVADEPSRAPIRITHAEYLASLRTVKGVPVERYWDPVVQVDGAVATVWAAYDLHVDGTFSHCGHDVFTLVKRPDGWRIAGGVFSVRRKDCPESPQAPPVR
jgi:ketosteroid isomerase-like protein